MHNNGQVFRVLVKSEKSMSKTGVKQVFEKLSFYLGEGRWQFKVKYVQWVFVLMQI